jgi:hypothetical protein
LKKSRTKPDRVLVLTQVVGAHRAAGKQQRVVVVDRRVADDSVDLDLRPLVDVRPDPQLDRAKGETLEVEVGRALSLDPG